MPNPFPIDVPPFRWLTATEREKLEAATDIAFYPAGTRLLTAGERPDHLFVVVKGVVQELADDDLVGVHGANDCFDGPALFDGVCRNSFVVGEDLISRLIPKAVVLDLAAGNPQFAGFFSESIAERVRSENGEETAGLLATPVSDATLDPPIFVDAGTSLRDVARILANAGAKAVLVRDGKRTGIATRSDLGAAVLLKDAAPDAAVGTIANYTLISIAADASLSEAMLQMTRHLVRRLIVMRDGTIVGVLELVSLLAALTNRSPIISTEIARATSIDALRPASAAIARLVRALAANGTRIDAITGLVTALNRALLRRTFELVAPADLIANSCLFVMGSEARGEQAVRTDQDNALILGADGDAAVAASACEAFGAALLSFGFPPCPGNMMVSNPVWRQNLGDYEAQIHRWIALPGEASFESLAALADAAPVAGDAQLLDALKAYLVGQLAGEAPVLGQFARSTVAFDTPRGRPLTALIGGSGDGIDIKKAAIFPIVHGIRSLALEQRLAETGTDQRIAALSERGLFDGRFAADLRASFRFLLTLRLGAELTAEAAPDTHGPIVNWTSLSRMEAHLLKDSLNVVTEFKSLVAHHFRLGYF